MSRYLTAFIFSSLTLLFAIFFKNRHDGFHSSSLFSIPRKLYSVKNGGDVVVDSNDKDDVIAHLHFINTHFFMMSVMEMCQVIHSYSLSNCVYQSLHNQTLKSVADIFLTNIHCQSLDRMLTQILYSQSIRDGYRLSDLGKSILRIRMTLDALIQTFKFQCFIDSPIEVVEEIRSVVITLKATLTISNKPFYTSVDERLMMYKNVTWGQLDHLQKESRKQLECYLSSTDLGFGTRLERAGFCLMSAFQGHRKVVFKTPQSFFLANFRMFSDGSHSRYSIYDISPTFSFSKLPTRKRWPSVLSQPKTWINVKNFVSRMTRNSRSEEVPILLPRNLLNKSHWFPNFLMWYYGIIDSYLMQPDNILLSMFRERSDLMNLTISPICGLHIRREEKPLEDFRQPSIHDYMSHVENFFHECDFVKGERCDRRIHVATDDVNIFTQLEQHYHHFQVYGSRKVAEEASAFRKSYGQSDIPILNVILDIMLLTEMDCFVGTLSSHVSRVVHELRTAARSENWQNTWSIDNRWVPLFNSHPVEYDWTHTMEMSESEKTLELRRRIYFQTNETTSNFLKRNTKISVDPMLCEMSEKHFFAVSI